MTSQPQQLHPDMPVDATDGHFGRLAFVVVDPVRKAVTHLVVRRAHTLHARDHLVPMDVAEPDGDRLRLSWSRAEVEASQPVDETDFIELGGWPHRTPTSEVGVVRVLSWPYFPAVGHLAESPGPDDTDTLVTYDRIPVGTVEIRRQSEVYSSEHVLLGHVEGFVVDSDHAVTHVVLQHGHLCGEREATIPISAVARMTTDAVYLTLSRAEVEALEPARFHRHDS